MVEYAVRAISHGAPCGNSELTGKSNRDYIGNKERTSRLRRAALLHSTDNHTCKITTLDQSL